MKKCSALIFVSLLLSNLAHAQAPNYAAISTLIQNHPVTIQLSHLPKNEQMEALIISNRTINTPLDCAHTTFQKKLLLTEVNMHSPLNCTLSLFEAPFSINASHFFKKFDIKLARFKNTFSLNHSIFYEPANFYDTQFERTANIQRNQFLNTTDFSSAIFFKPVNFSNSLFKEKVLFQKTVFQAEANFSRATFDAQTNFQGAHFKKETKFDQTIFNETSNFSGARFDSEVSFNDTEFSKKIDFSNITFIKNTIDLTHIKSKIYGKNILINLVGTDLSKIKINYSKLKLYFPENTPFETISKIYLSLLNKFKKEGLNHDYNTLYAEYKNFTYTAKNKPIMNQVDKIWWNYGLNKGRIFTWIALLLTIYTMINTGFYQKLISECSAIPFIGKSADLPVKNPIVKYTNNLPKAFVFTLIMFASGFLRLGPTIADFKSRNPFINIYLIFITASGFVCLVFILQYLISGALP